MKKTLLALFLLLITGAAYGEERFGRPVIKVKDAKEYQFEKLDDVEYPSLSNDRVRVSCLVYRGIEHYYVEVKVTNKTSSPVPLPLSFVTFDKPGFTLFRTDTMMAAQEAAVAGGMRFTPIPAPYVPPTYNTTTTATATTYGNQTSISGTSTTTADNSGQAGANLGNAIGNAVAAHNFYKAQRINVAFSHFLAAHDQTDMDTPLQPGQSRTIVATFEQSKQKRKDFDIDIKVGDDSFQFAFKE